MCDPSNCLTFVWWNCSMPAYLSWTYASMNSSKLGLLGQREIALQGRTLAVVSFIVWTWEGQTLLHLMYIPNLLANILVHGSLQVSMLSISPSKPQIWVSYPCTSAVKMTCFPEAKPTPPNPSNWRKIHLWTILFVSIVFLGHQVCRCWLPLHVHLFSLTDFSVYNRVNISFC